MNNWRAKLFLKKGRQSYLSPSGSGFPKNAGIKSVLDSSLFNKSPRKRQFHLLGSHPLTDKALTCMCPSSLNTGNDCVVYSARVQVQWNCLPSVALWTFSKCEEMALEPLPRKDIRVLFHLDILILMASSRETARRCHSQLINESKTAPPWDRRPVSPHTQVMGQPLSWFLWVFFSWQISRGDLASPSTGKTPLIPSMRVPYGRSTSHIPVST